MAPISISPLPQLDYKFKMDSAEWYVGWTTRLLFTSCYVIAYVHLSIRNIVSETNFILFTYTFSTQTFYFVHIHIFNRMLLILKDLLKQISSLPNEMTMCRICTSSCGSGEIVNYITLTIWRHCWEFGCIHDNDKNANSVVSAHGQKKSGELGIYYFFISISFGRKSKTNVRDTNLLQ